MPSHPASLPVDIRVPLNTHPSRLPPTYGTVIPEDGIPGSDSLSDSPRERSFRTAVGSFAGSYSRASMMYMAENLTVPSSSLSQYPSNRFGAFHDYDDEESRQNGDAKSARLPLYDDSTGIGLTMSQRTTTGVGNYIAFPSLSRHTTVASIMSQQLQDNMSESSASRWVQPPRSTFIQSVFNAVNVLIGIGILALPLAFRYSGWVFGTFIFLFCAIGTNYTAKVIIRCLDVVPGAVTYGDMGAAVFNESGRTFISGVFIVELMTIGIALVVLLGDGIQSFWPQVNLITVRVITFLILTPTMFLPMRKLAITSLIGIIASITLLVIIVIDGFYKKSQPGSLLDPMDTEIVPSDVSNIPLAFGLVMAGFSGHAVFPAIYRDMEDPKQYNRMVDISYLITGLTYISMAIVGYMMFGLETMQEITQNLASTPGYHKALNHLGVSLVLVTPIAKYGLMLNPVNITWELWLLGRPSLDAWCKFHPWRGHIITGAIRIATSFIVVLVATVFPGFDRVVSLLGALFSFGISAIFPLACYRYLFKNSVTFWTSFLNNTILCISVVMAVLGTIWSFLPNPM